jgi:hypothetical protein
VPTKLAARGLALPCLTHASCWAGAPRWGGRLRCWLAAPLPLPQTWTCSAVQIATRVSLSLYLGPRLVNVVSLRKRPNFLYLQHKLSPCPDALQHIFPPPPVAFASSCHSGTCNSLNSGFTPGPGSASAPWLFSLEGQPITPRGSAFFFFLRDRK